MVERSDGEYAVSLDAGRWSTVDLLHDDFAGAFGFPDHYGRNLDALFDCLRDVAEASPARDGGLVIVIRGYARFERAHPATAAALLSTLDDLATTIGVVSVIDDRAS